MESDEFGMNIVYRVVNGTCRDRLDPMRYRETPEQGRADPLKGVRPFSETTRIHPRLGETIQAAVDDAIAGRQLRW